MISLGVLKYIAGLVLVGGIAFLPHDDGVVNPEYSRITRVSSNEAKLLNEAFYLNFARDFAMENALPLYNAFTETYSVQSEDESFSQEVVRTIVKESGLVSKSLNEL